MSDNAKTQRLVIDLERNEALAKIVADKEPGEKLEATLRIVHKNDKTLTIELEDVVDDTDGAATELDDESDDDAPGESTDDTPAMRVARG